MNLLQDFNNKECYFLGNGNKKMYPFGESKIKKCYFWEMETKNISIRRTKKFLNVIFGQDRQWKQKYIY